jgi:hypothetical protein
VNPLALSTKLRILPGTRALVLDAPDDVAFALPEGASLASSGKGPFDVVLAYALDAKALAKVAAKAKGACKDGGALWLAYPKLTAKIAGDLSRERACAVVAPLGLGPVSQIALDETWSAMRFKPEETVKRKAGSVLATPPAKTAPAKTAPAKKAPAKKAPAKKAPATRRAVKRA